MLVTFVSGLVTFRAYNQIDFYRNDFVRNVEKGANATFSFLVTNRWISYRLDLVVLIFSTCTAALTIILKNQIDKAQLAFVL